VSDTRRALLGGALAAGALAAQTPEKKVHYRGEPPKTTPLFPGAVTYGNLVYISGHGVATGGIKEQTARVLDEIEQMLEKAGSSMRKALKVGIYLTDIRNYAEMNEVYLGRFGPEPPARTCLAVAAIPLRGCLVEIEVTAYI